MAAPYLGGHAITTLSWLSLHALRIVFTSTYGSLYQYQIYAGRRLAGSTSDPTDREMIAEVLPSDWPQHITLLAVPLGEALTDYGSLIAPRPFNVAKIELTTTGWPADTRYIEIAAGLAPGEAVDTDNIVSIELFDTNRTYTTFTDPLEGTGEWQLEIAGRDKTLPDGNRGTATPATLEVYAHPPDVAQVDDGARFGYSIEDGTLTVTFQEPA